MIGRLIVADQKLVMLNPLLFDKDLVGKWDGSYGAHGLNLLSMTLYFDLIRELTAVNSRIKSKYSVMLNRFNP